MEEKTRNKRKVGSHYEQEASVFLQKQGFEILEMNYQNRQGEIDIIARDGKYLVFVEVKYRKNKIFGYPEEAVHRQKQQKIRYTASHYLYCHNYGEETPCRFDVVTIMGEQILLIRDAF